MHVARAAFEDRKSLVHLAQPMQDSCQICGCWLISSSVSVNSFLHCGKSRSLAQDHGTEKKPSVVLADKAYQRRS
jgi:hypothetical protein